MPFSPEEIQSKEFLITLRGYDKDEVNAFLRAVADDYRDLMARGGAAEAASSGGGSFEALGQEVSGLLQVARETAGQMRRKAEEEATHLRRRAEEEASTLREAATKAARRLTEEAERHSIEVRGRAESEANERLRESVRRVERLQATETKVRQRLFSLETMLQSMRQELEAVETAGLEPDEQPLEPAPEPMASGDERDQGQEMGGDEVAPEPEAEAMQEGEPAKGGMESTEENQQGEEATLY